MMYVDRALRRELSGRYDEAFNRVGKISGSIPATETNADAEHKSPLVRSNALHGMGDVCTCRPYNDRAQDYAELDRMREVNCSDPSIISYTFCAVVTPVDLPATRGQGIAVRASDQNQNCPKCHS